MPSGPTRATCDQVDARDQQRCVRCGLHLATVSGSRHHRQLRRHGRHDAANLVLLCGSGTTGCHGWAHAHPAEAQTVGLIVRSYHNPATVPVYFGSLRRWVQLNEEGTMTAITANDARQALVGLGVL